MNPEFLNPAIELSRQGMETGEGGAYGAVVVRNNQIIAANDPTTHAEMVEIRPAIRKLGSFDDPSRSELHINGEPCPMFLGPVQ